MYKRLVDVNMVRGRTYWSKRPVNRLRKFIPTNGDPVSLVDLRRELVKKEKMSPVTLTKVLRQQEQNGWLERFLDRSGPRPHTCYRLANPIDLTKAFDLDTWLREHIETMEGGLLMALRDILRHPDSPLPNLPMFATIGSGMGRSETMFQAYVSTRPWDIAGEFQAIAQSQSPDKRNHLRRQLEKRLNKLMEHYGSLRLAETTLEGYFPQGKVTRRRSPETLTLEE